MKERITFYDRNKKQICNIVMPYKNEWDWISVLEKLTSDQLKKVKESFLYYYTEWVGDNGWFADEDLENLYTFEEALCDFYSDTEDTSGFFTFEDVKEVSDKQKREHGITVRQLYKLAEAAGALDAPITVTYCCDDCWYSLEDEPLTESNFNITKKAIDITM